MGAQGTFVANNNIVSQSVAHLHVHVVPRTKGDGLRGFFWPRTKYGPGEAAAAADTHPRHAFGRWGDARTRTAQGSERGQLQMQHDRCLHL